jgi:hypothetical protein
VQGEFFDVRLQVPHVDVNRGPVWQVDAVAAVVDICRQACGTRRVEHVDEGRRQHVEPDVLEQLGVVALPLPIRA